jgi:hypothetical protein
MVGGEMPVERSAQLVLLLLYLCFTWIGGVDSRYGATADQGRTGRKDSSSRLWRPARALGTHAKQGPSTGHSAVGLRQPGNTLLTPRPHFTAHHARLVIKWFVLRTALLFVRSAVRLVYTELPGRVAVCLPKQALCQLCDRVLGGDRVVEPVESSAAPPPPPLTAPPSRPRHGLPGPTQSKPRAPASTATTGCAPTASTKADGHPARRRPPPPRRRRANPRW